MWPGALQTNFSYNFEQLYIILTHFYWLEVAGGPCVATENSAIIEEINYHFGLFFHYSGHKFIKMFALTHFSIADFAAES